MKRGGQNPNSPAGQAEQQGANQSFAWLLHPPTRDFPGLWKLQLLR